MSEQTAQEPTMEEILASIRRIISEDDAPAAAGEAAAEAPDE
jgi:cell pole-organizing protein PopZ